MNSFFIDSDVIIDLLLEREPFVYSSRHVLAMIEAKKAEGFTTAVVAANVYYLLKKYLGKAVALSAVRKLISFLTIIPISHENISNALNNPGDDFEDSMQQEAAKSGKCDYIVTRNIKHYSDIAGCSPILPEQALTIVSQ